MLKGVRQLATNEPQKRGRLRWVRLELALFLARTTGRRRGAIVGLRWEDVDFRQRRITWRAEHDKKRVEWVTPHPYWRGWASERMHFPLKVVADAGGWKDVATLVRCYQQTDDRTLLAVIANEPSGRVRRNGSRAIAS